MPPAPHAPAIAALLFAGLVACAPPPYACTDDPQCDRGSQPGQCLPDGACAYPDTSGRCESGWVRSPNAADDPGACVPAETDSDSDTADTTGPVLPPIACETRVALVLEAARLPPPSERDGYPQVIMLSDPGLVAAITAAGGAVAFTDPEGRTLASELTTLDPDAGTLTAWVRLGALTDPAMIWLAYGAEVEPGDPALVWQDHFAGVWHFDDSLANSATPSEPGTTDAPQSTPSSGPGVVGPALLFDGTDDVVRVAGSFIGALSSFSIGWWGRYDGDGSQAGSYFSRLNGSVFYPRCWRLSGDLGGRVLCQYEVGGGGAIDLFSSQAQAPGQLHHFAMVRDAATARTTLYVDGEPTDSTEDPPGALDGGGETLEIGTGEFGVLPGMIDELRVGLAPWPAAWVRADALAQGDPTATVQSVGVPEPCPT